jgi:hypothetical protein
MVSEPHFRWRGGEITRLESFTDAVFAFAVTLPAVSLEVPRTFEELLVAMNGFFALPSALPRKSDTSIVSFPVWIAPMICS